MAGPGELCSVPSAPDRAQRRRVCHRPARYVCTWAHVSLTPPSTLLSAASPRAEVARSLPAAALAGVPARPRHSACCGRSLSLTRSNDAETKWAGRPHRPLSPGTRSFQAPFTDPTGYAWHREGPGKQDAALERPRVPGPGQLCSGLTPGSWRGRAAWDANTGRSQLPSHRGQEAPPVLRPGPACPHTWPQPGTPTALRGPNPHTPPRLGRCTNAMRTPRGKSARRHPGEVLLAPGGSG